MNIQIPQAEQKLVSLASSIGHAPLSWVGWSCLYLDLADMDDDMRQECLLWIRSVIESYFGGVESRVYVCHGLDVHIICKLDSVDILRQAGEQIRDLAYNESRVEIYYHIYNLARDAHDYVQMVLDKEGQDQLSYHKETNSVATLPKACQGKEEQQAQFSGERVKVLLVEDDPVTRWMVRNALKQDCEFITAPTANKAFALYNSYQPDIVFLDIGLPDKSGHDVLEWIMRNDPGACVVMFSSNDNLDNITNALEEGATGFVKKPFLKESLLHYIHNYVG